MSDASLSRGRFSAHPVLADGVFARGVVMDSVLVAAGALFVAIAAQIAVPLWPVPITGQTLAVLLVGSSLGALRGTLAMVLYAVLGIVGLPVFSDASSGFSVIAGPTGGYIVGFILSAALVGWIAERTWDRRFTGAVLSFLGGTVVTFAVGLPWLAVSLGLDLQQTLEFGLYPFVIGGVVKALLAAAIIPLAWHSRRARADDED